MHLEKLLKSRAPLVLRPLVTERCHQVSEQGVIRDIEGRRRRFLLPKDRDLGTAIYPSLDAKPLERGEQRLEPDRPPGRGGAVPRQRAPLGVHPPIRVEIHDPSLTAKESDSRGLLWRRRRFRLRAGIRHHPRQQHDQSQRDHGPSGNPQRDPLRRRTSGNHQPASWPVRWIAFSQRAALRLAHAPLGRVGKCVVAPSPDRCSSVRPRGDASALAHAIQVNQIRYPRACTHNASVHRRAALCAPGATAD